MEKINIFILEILILIIPLVIQARESDIVEKHCKSLIEYRLHNGTRVDCLTTEYVIEYDYAYKWYESITQALYYAMETDKRARVVLILKKESDQRHVDRAIKLIHHYDLPITLLTVSEIVTNNSGVK